MHPLANNRAIRWVIPPAPSAKMTTAHANVPIRANYTYIHGTSAFSITLHSYFLLLFQFFFSFLVSFLFSFFLLSLFVYVSGLPRYAKIILVMQENIEKRI